ncbi:MAG: hypothetical protein ACOC23_08800 [Thermodesulfobacteriota bacterium]
MSMFDTNESNRPLTWEEQSAIMESVRQLYQEMEKPLPPRFTATERRIDRMKEWTNDADRYNQRTDTKLY